LEDPRVARLVRSKEDVPQRLKPREKSSCCCAQQRRRTSAAEAARKVELLRHDWSRAL